MSGSISLKDKITLGLEDITIILKGVEVPHPQRQQCGRITVLMLAFNWTLLEAYSVVSTLQDKGTRRDTVSTEGTATNASLGRVNSDVSIHRAKLHIGAK